MTNELAAAGAKMACRVLCYPNEHCPDMIALAERLLSAAARECPEYYNVLMAYEAMKAAYEQSRLATQAYAYTPDRTDQARNDHVRCQNVKKEQEDYFFGLGRALFE